MREGCGFQLIYILHSTYYSNRTRISRFSLSLSLAPFILISLCLSFSLALPLEKGMKAALYAEREFCKLNASPCYYTLPTGIGRMGQILLQTRSHGGLATHFHTLCISWQIVLFVLREKGKRRGDRLVDLLSRWKSPGLCFYFALHLENLSSKLASVQKLSMGYVNCILNNGSSFNRKTIFNDKFNASFLITFYFYIPVEKKKIANQIIKNLESRENILSNYCLHGKKVEHTQLLKKLFPK